MLYPAHLKSAPVAHFGMCSDFVIPQIYAYELATNNEFTVHMFPFALFSDFENSE